MKKIFGMLRFTAENLGPVIVFIVLSRMFGTKIAIAGTVAFAAVDIARRFWMKVGFTTLYIVSAGMTVGFGSIDLMSETPFMLRFEPVISNLVTAGVFLIGAFGKRSMILELVEQQRGAPFVDRPDLIRFFIYMTLAWAVYFFVKAMIYLWMGLAMPLERAMEIRSVFGTVSLVAMIGLVTLLARPSYFLLMRLGLLPPRPEPPAPQTQTTA